MRYAIAAACLALAACGPTKPDRPPLPPEVVEVPVQTYVPVPDEYLQPCRWRKTAPLEAMPQVAAERKKCLLDYEADREAIRKIRGKSVPTET